MAKFSGVVGFYRSVKDPTSPGVWVNDIVERTYYGDVTKYGRKFESGTGVNDNISLNLVVSLISDHYILENIGDIRYVVYKGTRWKVTSVDEINMPRIVLHLGGVFNGE